MKHNGTDKSDIWEEWTDFGRVVRTCENILVSETSSLIFRSSSEDEVSSVHNSVQIDVLSFSISTRLARLA